MKCFVFHVFWVGLHNMDETLHWFLLLRTFYCDIRHFKKIKSKNLLEMKSCLFVFKLIKTWINEVICILQPVRYTPVNMHINGCVELEQSLMSDPRAGWCEKVPRYIIFWNNVSSYIVTSSRWCQNVIFVPIFFCFWNVDKESVPLKKKI